MPKKSNYPKSTYKLPTKQEVQEKLNSLDFDQMKAVILLASSNKPELGLYLL